MQLFSSIYERVMRLSLLSFLESFILPFPPPDVMLAPMSLARPERALRFAALTLLFSVVGGLSVVRHRDGGNVFTSPWNQTRVWSSLRVDLGRDPGLTRSPSRP